MSGKYGITLTWKNGKKKFTFPVLPEKIDVTLDAINNTVTVLELGEIIEKGLPALDTYTWSGIFPKNTFAGVVVNNLKKPNDYVSTLDKIRSKQIVVKLTISGMKISQNCLITSFKYFEEGGDVGTIKYSITFKKYIKPKVRKMKKKSKGSSSGSSSAKSKTYKVKKGDTLRAIAQKKYKDASKWVELWNLNKSTIQKAAKKKGKKATKSKPYLVVGIVLKLS